MQQALPQATSAGQRPMLGGARKTQVPILLRPLLKHFSKDVFDDMAFSSYLCGTTLLTYSGMNASMVKVHCSMSEASTSM